MGESPASSDCVHCHGPPHVIVMQQKAVAVAKSIIGDLQALRDCIPGATLLWFALLECWVWRVAAALDQVDLSGRQF